METKFLALADLKGKTAEEVKQHLCEEYSGTNSGFDYGNIETEDIEKAKNLLSDLSVVLAYESTGDYGCDSSAFFILTDSEKFYEVHAGHCSCFGFEGQLDLEPTTLIALKKRASEDKLFWTGGYDNNSELNQSQANQFVLSYNNQKS